MDKISSVERSNNKPQITKRISQFIIDAIKQPNAQEIVDAHIEKQDQFTIGEIVSTDIGRYCNTDCLHQLAIVSSEAFFINTSTIGINLQSLNTTKSFTAPLLFVDINGAWRKSIVGAISKTEVGDFVDFPE